MEADLGKLAARLTRRALGRFSTKQENSWKNVGLRNGSQKYKQPWGQELAPSMESILEFVSVIFVSVVPQLAGSSIVVIHPDHPKNRRPLETLVKYWTASVSAIAVVLLVAIGQPDNIASLGILTARSTPGTDNGTAILVSIILVSFLVIAIMTVYGLGIHIGKGTRDEKPDTTNPAVIMFLGYQDFFGRTAYLTVLPLVVIAEELVYRAYLVLFLGNQTGTFIPWIVLSLVLSVLVHLYQGRNARNLILQTVYAAFFIALTLITRNILTSIVAHIYFNLISTSQTWRHAKELGGQSEPSISNKPLYAVIAGVNILSLYGLLQFVSYPW